MASKCSSERKNLMSLTLYQKLEMIVLSEEGLPKAKILGNWPLKPVSQVLNQRKISWRQLKVLVQLTHEG